MCKRDNCLFAVTFLHTFFVGRSGKMWERFPYSRVEDSGSAGPDGFESGRPIHWQESE